MIAYLSHSLATGNGHGHAQIQRHDNIANALAWLEFLIEATPWVVLIPWYPSAILLRELWRERAWHGDLRVIPRFDLFVMTGGVVSDRMKDLAEHAVASRVGVVDLTDLGIYPPHAITDEVRELLRARADEALVYARRSL